MDNYLPADYGGYATGGLVHDISISYIFNQTIIMGFWVALLALACHLALNYKAKKTE